jgi:hypothetical protein
MGSRRGISDGREGQDLGPTGLEKGYLVTSGYALSCISFSTALQSQSEFRYLGEEKIDSRETYVLGFAQQPGEARFLTTMTVVENRNVGCKSITPSLAGMVFRLDQSSRTTLGR